MQISRHYSEAPSQIVEKVYFFREKEEVLAFLDNNSLLIPLLETSPSNIKNYFPEAELILEVINHPEEVDESHLTLFISTSLQVEQAMEKYDRFFDEWWLKVLLGLPRPLRGKLNMNLEFQ